MRYAAMYYKPDDELLDVYNEEGRDQRLRRSALSQLGAGGRRLKSGPFQSGAELSRAFEP
jgi:hypothetical protein